MYKIYINETKMILCKSNELDKYKNPNVSSLISRYTGKVKFLHNHIDLAEKTKDLDSIIIHSKRYQKLKSDFKSLYNIIHAAGGLVCNEFEEKLIIFRRGFWDLPKGKIEIGEGKRAAAMREVMEETGVKKLQMLNKVTKTRHTYTNSKGKRVLKLCHWYLMTTHKQKLIPQTEEDIKQVIWADNKILKNYYPKFYQNINTVFHQYNTQTQ